MMHVLMSLLLCILLLNGDGLFLTTGLTEDVNMGSCIEQDRQALLDVKVNLVDLNGSLNDWASEGEKLDCCKWVGVTCNNHSSRVIGLDLTFASSSLRGKVSPSLQVLNQLEYLNLSGVNFQFSSLPNVFGSLSNLQVLDISGANLSGSIPLSFGDLTSLTHLDLSKNQLGGNIPKSLGNCSSLVKLDLSQNLLNGSMPDSIGQLSDLEYFNVGHNSLNGSIPNSLGQVSKLRILDFSSNSLQGVISDVHFLNLSRLRYLDLSFNTLALDLNFIPFQLSTIKLQSCKLGPSFPMWIRTQRDINHLDISNAGISDSIPDWFSNLPTGLSFLNLSTNQIKGTLPNITSFSYGAMDLSNNHFEGRVAISPSRLAALNLSGNKLSGTLSFLCEIDAFVSFLDLSNNSFFGSVPDCWVNRRVLKILNLSNNNLSGEIPSSFGDMFSVEAMYLRANAFVGELPMSLGNCIRLRFLDIGENKLSGVIPGWIGEQLSELYVLVLGSNRFYGSLPDRICWLSNLQVLDLANSGLSESLISQEDHFLDKALITWKGKERSFERSGLQLLKSIDLSGNNFSGILSYEITSLTDLASLNLSANKLHGEVPKDMGRLKSLQSLDLSRNEFSGNIPGSLAQLNSLGVLNVSNNNLSGKIPTGRQLQLFDSTSYSGNPQLCGPPLTPIVENTNGF